MADGIAPRVLMKQRALFWDAHRDSYCRKHNHKTTRCGENVGSRVLTQGQGEKSARMTDGARIARTAWGG